MDWLNAYAERGRGFLVEQTKKHTLAELAEHWPASTHMLPLAVKALGWGGSYGKGLGTSAIFDMQSLAAFVIRWALQGNPVLAPTHGLLAKLLLTDCGKVSPADLKFPYGTYAIRLPEPSPLHIAGPSGPEAVRLVLVSSQKQPPPNHEREAWEEFHARSRTTPPHAYGALVRELEEKYGYETYTSVRLATESGFSVYRWNVLDPKEPTLEGWLQGADHEYDGVGMVGLEDLDRHALATGMRLVANLALYVTQQRRSQASYPSKAGTVLRPRFDARNPITSFVVGAEVKVDRELREAAFDRANHNRARWKLSSRHMVVGHWKQQPCGQGQTERVRRWIEPYWRGEGTTAAVERVYRDSAR